MIYLENFRNSFLYDSFLPIVIGCMNREIVKGNAEGKGCLRIRDTVFIAYVNVFYVQLHILDDLRDQLFDECFIEFVFWKILRNYTLCLLFIYTQH